MQTWDYLEYRLRGRDVPSQRVTVSLVLLQPNGAVREVDGVVTETDIGMDRTEPRQERESTWLPQSVHPTILGLRSPILLLNLLFEIQDGGHGTLTLSSSVLTALRSMVG